MEPREKVGEGDTGPLRSALLGTRHRFKLNSFLKDSNKLRRVWY